MQLRSKKRNGNRKSKEIRFCTKKAQFTGNRIPVQLVAATALLKSKPNPIQNTKHSNPQRRQEEVVYSNLPPLLTDQKQRYKKSTKKRDSVNRSLQGLTSQATEKEKFTRLLELRLVGTVPRMRDKPSTHQL
jgi:hypothetical protein